jgi:polysaccharide biosynthesis protein PslH
VRILSINTFFPLPTRRGMDVVYLNLLKTQALKHEVTLVSMRRAGDEDDLLHEILPYVRKVHLAGDRVRGRGIKVRDRLRSAVLSPLLWRPSCTFYDHSPEMARVVADVSSEAEFDVIEVHHSPSAGLIRHARGGGARLLYMYDVHSRSTARLASTRSGVARARAKMEASKYRHFEPIAAREFHGVLFGQEEDMRIFAPLLPPHRVTGLMPNIVDTDRFQPGPGAGSSRAIVFVGAMSHRANVDAIHHFQAHVWDQIRARVRDVELWLVGATPPDEIRALNGTRSIRVHADVTDVRPFINAAMIYVAPLRIGSGVKVKIMEAMAMGKAIVATPVAAEGMELSHGEDIKVHDLSIAFVDSVVELLNNQAERKRLQERARATAVQRFSFPTGALELDDIFARLPL